MIIVAIAAVGVYVYHHDHKKTVASVSTVSSTEPQAQTSQVTATPTGTNSGINQLIQQNEQAESSAYTTEDSQITQNAQPPTAAISNMEGAYNASNL